MRYGLKLPGYEAGKPFEFEREMGYSRAEFLQVAQQSLAGKASVSGVDDGVCVETVTGRLTLRVLESSQRRLGVMALPVSRVRFAFEGMSERQIQQWLDVLERTFHRGGG